LILPEVVKSLKFFFLLTIFRRNFFVAKLEFLCKVRNQILLVYWRRLKTVLLLLRTLNIRNLKFASRQCRRSWGCDHTFQ